MRATWCDRLGDSADLEVRETPLPVLDAGQALVRVRAAALNYPDVLLVAGRYQVRFEPPFIPGSEFAGEVVADPSGRLAEGARVTGTAPCGGFAEHVAVDVDRLLPLPAELDFVAGAAFRVTYSTAYHALITIGAAERGHSVVVLGAAGGVGLATVDLAHRLGLHVIAAASSPRRLGMCRDHGADETIDYSQESLKARLKEIAPAGVDVIVDPVGGELADAALRAIAWGGRFVTVGYAAGSIPRIPLNLVLLKGAQIRGFEMRGLAAHRPEAIVACDETLTRLIAEGMRPHIDATFGLADVRSAFAHVVDRKVIGKVVLDLDL